MHVLKYIKCNYSITVTEDDIGAKASNYAKTNVAIFIAVISIQFNAYSCDLIQFIQFNFYVEVVPCVNPFNSIQIYPIQLRQQFNSIRIYSI